MMDSKQARNEIIAVLNEYEGAKERFKIQMNNLGIKITIDPLPDGMEAVTEDDEYIKLLETALKDFETLLNEQCAEVESLKIALKITPGSKHVQRKV